MEEEHNFMDKWRWRNNILIFGIKEYFEHDRGYIKNETESGHFELAYTDCLQTGQGERRKTDCGQIYFVLEEVTSAARTQKSGRNKDKNRTRL